jgi:outer membrane protein assembly factor BamE (lipoprotein component of BamABCDE complex)
VERGADLPFFVKGGYRVNTWYYFFHHQSSSLKIETSFHALWQRNEVECRSWLQRLVDQMLALGPRKKDTFLLDRDDPDWDIVLEDG